MAGRRLLFKVLGLIAGVWFIGQGVAERSSMSRLKSHGRVAIVDPIDRYEKHSRRGDTSYSATFTFKTDRGEQISKQASFPAEVITDFESRVPVKVYYDPRNPSDFVFEKQRPSWFPVGFGIFLAVAALLFA